MMSLKERDLVTKLIKSLRENSPDAYVYVDRDSGTTRHTRSGWDFFVAYQGRIIFVEAKMPKGKLTDWQKFVRLSAMRAGCPYAILVFQDEKSFTMSHRIERLFLIDEVTVEDFLDA